MVRSCRPTLMFGHPVYNTSNNYMYFDKTKQNFAVNKPGEMNNNRNGMDSAESYLIRQSKQFGYDKSFGVFNPDRRFPGIVIIGE